MSVYYDVVGHMVADSETELHAFAESIGLKREWYQNKGTRSRLPHYDLMGSKVRLAKNKGAILITARQIVEKCKGMEREIQ